MTPAPMIALNDGNERQVGRAVAASAAIGGDPDAHEEL